MTDKWKKKLIKIAEYLSCNEGEFVIEVDKLCQEAIEEYKRTMIDKIEMYADDGKIKTTDDIINLLEEE